MISGIAISAQLAFSHRLQESLRWNKLGNLFTKKNLKNIVKAIV